MQDGNAVSYGQHKIRKIRPANSDNARVVRSYRTAMLKLANTNGVDNVNIAWSMYFGPDGEFYVKAGGPVTGSAVATDTLGDDYKSEYSNFAKVYKYMRITKVSCSAEKLPLWTTMPAMVIADPTASVTQLGNPGNIYSPGVFLQRPWAGEPGVASISTGALVGNPYQDNVRYKLARRTEASSKTGNGTFKQTYMPMTPYLDYESEASAPTPVVTPDYTVKFQRSPPICIDDLEVNKTSGQVYGGIFVWYFPSSVGAVTGQLDTNIFWEFEVEYFGMSVPVSSAASQASGTSASKDALIASLQGLPIDNYPEFQRMPEQKTMNEYRQDPTYVKIEQKDVPNQQVPTSTLQVPTQTLQAPKAVIKPGSRPSTPVLVQSRK